MPFFSALLGEYECLPAAFAFSPNAKQATFEINLNAVIEACGAKPSFLVVDFELVQF